MREARPRRIFEAVKDLLFPRRCPVCDGIVTPMGEKICASCLPVLKPVRAPWCMVCGKGLAKEGELCEECKNGKLHFFRRARALYDYPSVALSIYRFKYGARREYKDFFGEEMAKYLGDFILSTGAQALIPIPLHKRRMRKRGYNQAAELSKVLGAKLGLPTYENLLFRVKNTKPQKQQNSKERQNNLKKAFLVRKNDVKLKTIILIDDIYTTGTTADEAAKALTEAGIPDVYVVTLAGGMEA